MSATPFTNLGLEFVENSPKSDTVGKTIQLRRYIRQGVQTSVEAGQQLARNRTTSFFHFMPRITAARTAVISKLTSCIHG